jgi:citrate lyase beta subunit
MLSLVVPGSSERMLAKATRLEVEEIVIDLEDAVVPARKPEALAAAVRALAEGGFAAGRVSVRINPLDTDWAADELAALGSAKVPPAAIIVPKASRSALLRADVALADVSNSTTRLQALIETADGVARVEQVAGASTRLEALLIGYADLAVSLGRSPSGAADLDLWLAVQDRVLAAARAFGLRAIDGPYLSIDDTAGLDRSAGRAAALGFDGKWAIHPAQIDLIRTAFRPTTAEVQHAWAVIEALAAAATYGSGAVALDGRMLDEPVRLAALRTLARAGEEPRA